MRKRKHISARKREQLFELHGGICHICELPIDPVRDRWEISHDTPIELGGADDDENRKPAHYSPCHKERTSKEDIPRIAKARQQRWKNKGAKRSRNPLPGGRDSPWKKKIGGGVVRRDEET